MSSLNTLQARLKDIANSINDCKPLIDRLRNFTQAVGQGDEARLELGAEIHSRLKNVEEEMEILNVEVEGLEEPLGNQSSKRKATNDNIAEKNAEKKRVIGLAERLTVDLKKTRAEFRNAQLQANRNAEIARRKEREMLFARPSDRDESRKGANKFTQNDVVVNASGDVTAALRRTHELMQAELSRSQFAQETLEQSTAALSSLSESYSSLDTVLSSTRALVGSLLRSQKSDTWYLETAFYLLIGTITWLVFRRILYGPMWWLAWMPIKMVYRLFASVLGVTVFSGSVATTTSAIVSSGSTQVAAATAHTGSDTAKVVLEGEDAPVASIDTETEGDDVLDKINNIVEADGPDDSEAGQNPKKRMWEEPVGGNDEL